MPARPALTPQIRFLYIGSRVCSTLLSDPASRRRPCASLSLHLHQVVKRTFTFELLNMLGTHVIKGRLAAALVLISVISAISGERVLVFPLLLIPFDQDVFQQLGFVLKLGFAHREPVHAEHISENVGFGQPAHSRRII